MPQLSDRDNSVLVVVDVQPNFTKAIPDFETVEQRVHFLVEVALELEVPILYTEQYPERMGATEPRLAAKIDKQAFGKRAFSCCGSDDFNNALDGLGRNQVHLVGAETHICLAQTAIELRKNKYEVILPVDAVSGRVRLAHDATLRRLEQSGAMLTHTESVAYEWLKTSEHEKFKAILNLVKNYPCSS
ncbi:MAG: isochorismatase family protein [Fimbriimonadaceae bacterium]